nr:NAD-dependent dehydratase [Bacteroidales bacterium]
MKVLFIGGTGNISMACTRLAVKSGFDVYHLNRGSDGKDTPEEVKTITCDISKTEEVKMLLKDHSF